MSATDDFSTKAITAATKTETPDIAGRILKVIFAFLAIWIAAIFVWGYPALIVVKLALVPMIFTALILITWGK